MPTAAGLEMRCRALRKQGNTPQQIHKQLLSEGHHEDEVEAALAICVGHYDPSVAEDRKAGKAFGLILAVIGFGVTAYFMFFASERYIIFPLLFIGLGILGLLMALLGGPPRVAVRRNFQGIDPE